MARVWRGGDLEDRRADHQGDGEEATIALAPKGR
jgi:hypothetical protein